MMPDFSCFACREHLPEYTIGRLPEDLRRAVERHLDGCAECRHELAEWRAIEAAIRRAPALEPSRDFATVWRALQPELAPARSATIARERTLYMDADRPSSTLQDSPAPSPAAAPSQRRHASALARHARPLAAVAATLLLVVVGAALFALLHLGRQAPSGSSTPTPSRPCAPEQITAHIPSGGGINDLAMPTTNEGWAVGNVWSAARQSEGKAKSTSSSLLLHYSHCHWRQEGSSFPNMVLTSLAMSSTTEGWACGYVLPPLDHDRDQVL